MSVQVLRPLAAEHTSMALPLKAAMPRIGSACKLEASVRPSTPPILDSCLDCVARRRIIPAGELAEKIRCTEPLILDIRSFTAFNSGHITGAVNLSCSDRFTKRRLQSGKMTVMDLLKKHGCADNTSKLINLEIVVYDDATYDLSEIAGSHPLRLVVECLLKEGKEAQILQGGLREFEARYSQFCEKPLPDNGHCPLYSPTTPMVEPAIDTATASMILPYLYIGNERDAASFEKLQELGITHVLNITSHLPCHFEGQGIKYCRLPASDSGRQNLKQFFERAFQFIEEARQADGRVLIHCQAGVSRSPTITVAYIMKRTCMSMADAYRFVKHKRAIVSPNFNFMGQLMELEQALNKGEQSRYVDPDFPAESCV